MEIFLIILLGGPLIVGGVIAVIEHRKKTMFLKHDFNLAAPQSESDREVERAAQAFREAHNRSLIERP